MLPSSSRNNSLESALTTTHPLLQPDILQIVFSYLTPVPDLCQAYQVCTTWAKVASTPLLWRHVIVVDPPTPFATAHKSPWPIIEPILTRPPRETRAAKRARLSRSPLPQHNARGAKRAVHVISKRAGQLLQTLHLHRFCQRVSDPDYLVSDEQLDDLANRCGPSLQQFSVINSRAEVAGWVSFAECCYNLKVLHIIACPTLRTGHIGPILDFLPCLEDLSLRKCSQLRGIAFKIQLNSVRSSLKRIDISMTNISHIFIRELALEFPRLEHFVANNCPSLTISCRPFRLQHERANMFPNLVNLQLNYIEYFSECWISLVSNHCPRLAALGASVMDYGSLHSLFDEQAPPIEQLSLSGREVDDHLWQMIFEKVGSTLVHCDLSRTKTTCALTVHEGQQFSALESLNLSDTRATDESVRKIISIAPHLKHLKLTRCRGVKDRDFRRNPLRTTTSPKP
ncbi:hypothetical protein BWQ96_02015 [Gracilariopsis chorda]|uniref:F-box domain-containing protein n=1 Tax=Gracilariopsis chorda TaxID=448386 RepID=A0A2V3J177_9FLOR|nr:hypothetical protein BWQ96_02015 [Gracilariopsis chorda]|eukprot:PXF48063.1 hypothetical protein BWQ96_02015 [Gracilariopsis chorda]